MRDGLIMREHVVTEIEMYDCQDVMKILGCKQSTAYRVIRQLREELEDGGFMSPIHGKIQKNYFDKRFGLQERSINGNSNGVQLICNSQHDHLFDFI